MKATFGPRMESRITGFSVKDLKWRAWGGLVADLWDVECADGAQGNYLSPDPRLFVPLDVRGAGVFMLSDTHQSQEFGSQIIDTASFIPAGHATRGAAKGGLRLRHLDVHMSEAGVVRRFGRALSRQQIEEPRLSLQDARISALSRLLADALEASEPCHDLYLDGLANALLAVLFDIRPETERRRPALSRTQLRLTLDHIDAHCLESLRLADLARLVGVSETYFSHAFKAATGVPPHRFVMQERVRKAQGMMQRSAASIGSIAAECGFSDQAHFNRVFRQVTGLTPAVWKRDNVTIK
ncbi:helix-turn-helix domain-containing protein [Aliihoeflea sp. PC F10.4]